VIVGDAQQIESRAFDHLERNQIPAFDVPEKDRICSCCDEPMVLIGEDKTERGHIIPSKLVVNCYTTKKYGCPKGCEIKSGTGAQVSTLVEGSKYEASVYAHVVVAKFADHSPIHRIAAMFLRRGFDIAKSTMNDMVLRFAERIAEPIVDQAKKELLEEKYLQADESPLQFFVEDENDPKKKLRAKQGYIWFWRSGKKILMEFRPSREKEGPAEFLGKWRGILQTDGYAGYDYVVRILELLRAGCWSHTRRLFFEAVSAGYLNAKHFFFLIERLYAIEAAIKKRILAKSLSGDAALELTKKVRQRRSKPVIAKIEALVAKYANDQATLPKSIFGKAVGYAQNQMPTLKVYLDHPIVEIDNNAIERAVRPLALGRRNWLFAGSERGARAAANLYSLVSAAKLHGIDPEAYINDLINRFDATPPAEYGRLTPWAWAAEKASAGKTVPLATLDIGNAAIAVGSHP
jgi:transposase